MDAGVSFERRPGFVRVDAGGRGVDMVDDIAPAQRVEAKDLLKRHCDAALHPAIDDAFIAAFEVSAA